MSRNQGNHSVALFLHWTSSHSSHCYPMRITMYVTRVTTLWLVFAVVWLDHNIVLIAIPCSSLITSLQPPLNLTTGTQSQIPGLHFVIFCCYSSVQTLNCWGGRKTMRPHSARRPGLWEDHWRMERNFILNCKLYFPILVAVRHFNCSMFGFMCN